MIAEQWEDIESAVLEAAGLPDEELERWLSNAPEPLRQHARLLLDAPPLFGPWAAVAAARAVSSTPRLKVPCTLSHYRVLRRIGAGGMGEVYEAEDPRLRRKVAIKVLHSGAATPIDEEAQALARLRHPNICRIYDVGRAGDIDYFVMELLDGFPLSSRLEKGRLPLSEALSIATAVARALAEAHRLGIVHRDVKPANILLTRNGPILVDFGIADTIAESAGIPAGTPPYMAPEQSRGVSDPRSDIYSLGAVLREMLSPHDTVGALQKVIDTCLQEDPEERWQNAADLARSLDWLQEPLPVQSHKPAWRKWWPAIAAAALALALLAYMGTRADSPSPVLIPIHTTGNHSIRNEWEVAVAPDASRIAFIAPGDAGEPLIWLRKLDSLVPEPLRSTVGAGLVFWSPDGQSLGFVAQGQLQTLHLATGTRKTLASVAGPPLRGIWGDDGQILYATDNPLGDGVIYRIPSNGGVPQRVTALNQADDEMRQGFAALLPGGEHFLFVAGSNLMVATQDEPGHTYLASFQRPGWRKLVLRGAFPAGTVGDRVYYVRDAEKKVWSRRLDVATGEWLTEPRLEVDGASWARVTPSGALLYMPAPSKSRPAWVDRYGRKLSDLPVPAGAIYGVGLSRDGTAFVTRQEDESAGIGLWVVRGNEAQRLGSGPGRYVIPAWSADGKWIYFAGYDGSGLHRKRPFSGGEEELVLPRNGEDKNIRSTTQDGRYGFGVAIDTRTHRGLDVIRVDFEKRERQYWSATKEGETQPMVSPNDRWVAWSCEIYLRGRLCVSPIDNPRSIAYVTDVRAGEPKWSRDGRQLYFVSADWLHVMQVSSEGNRFTFGTPERLFRLCEPHRFGDRYAVAGDNRFLVREPFNPPSPPVLVWSPPSRRM